MACKAEECPRHIVYLFPAIFISLFSGFATAEEIRPYVGYDISETLRTETDHRDRLTQIFLEGGGYVGFRYREDVFGSTDKVVTAIKYSNEYKIKVTRAEQDQLTEALLNAKVFDLKNDPKPEHFADVRPIQEPTYYSDLDVRIQNQNKRYAFYTHPTAPDRAAIHKVIFDFAKRMKVDQPDDLSKATFVSEGDLQPSQPVSLTELLMHPGNYQGKRVSVIGYRRLEFEGNRLCADKEASEKFISEKCLGTRGISTFADSKNLNGKNNTWQVLEGVFEKGADGVFTIGWPGYLERITSSKTVNQPANHE